MALAIAFLNGLLLGQIGALAGGPGYPSPAGPSLAAETTVRAFYDGMNRYLATGDDAFLRLLAPGFREFQRFSSSGGSGDLLARLEAHRHSMLSSVYAIQDIQVLGSLVEVRLSARPSNTLDVAGLTLVAPPTRDPVEFVQLERNVIVARWSDDELTPLIDPVMDERFVPTVRSVAAAGMTFSQLTPGIQRVSLEPGEEIDAPSGGPIGLIVETGTVSIENAGESERMSTGDRRFIDLKDRLRVTNVADEASAIWLVSTEQEALPVHQRCAFASTQLPVGDARGQLRLRITRVTLLPGAELPVHRASLGEDIVVIDGALDARVSDGDLLHCQEDGQGTMVYDRDSVTPGEGISVSPDALVSYQVTGAAPATLLVMTVVPAA